MVQIKKCQSKKHNGKGCDDPRCPERVSVEAALNAAVLNEDLNKFLSIREQLEENPLSGIAKIIWKKNQTQEFQNQQLLLNKNKVQNKLSRGIKSYPDLYSLRKDLNEHFYPHAQLIVEELGNDSSGFDLKGVSVDDMQVAPEYRDMGIGRYIRATILKFADEHNYVVTGIPTEGGDGSIQSHEEGFREHALAHRTRLENWYLNHGYEYNYAFDTAEAADPLTGEAYPTDPSWETKLHPAAVEYLRDSGFYIRWPNNTIPENWKADADRS